MRIVFRCFDFRTFAILVLFQALQYAKVDRREQKYRALNVYILIKSDNM